MFTDAQVDDLFLIAGSFPRGPGFYFHPVKLGIVVALYLIWVRACWWVDRDCREVGLQIERYNLMMLVGGLAGLVLTWAIPIFWAALPVILLGCLGPILVYANFRNRVVDEADRVFTPEHLRSLLDGILGKRKKSKDPRHRVIPVRLIGKSDDGRGEDPSKVNRAQESQYYRSALELVHEAILLRATDIHLEPTKEEMIIRYRIDGIMQSQPAMDRERGDAVLNIFKVLANMDITEKRKAQDGSFSAEVQTPIDEPVRKKGADDDIGLADDAPKMIIRLVDFRVATAGSVVGEKMVMRLLDRSRAIADLGRLGMREKLRDQIRHIVEQPHGMFVVCGPTGSGKSTTLYACLSEIDRYQKNVITVENPVEYHIDGVTQIEVNPKAGKTFASELRSILRQDPDLIYIGEVRDQETAEIACQAAQTGHMVFTTLHSNDTATAVLRLIDLGVQPFMVGNSLSAVLGQRLVRKLCGQCKVAYRPNPEMIRRANLPVDRIRAFYRPPKGDEPGSGENDPSQACPHCSGTGYRGRTGIFELLVINDRIRELIQEGATMETIRSEAAKAGMMFLQQDGMRVVIEGDTSIEELLRVAK